ncbi:MAG: GDSL-type esterase/lipase family protein [Bryobacteraceae bacterium]
MRAFAVHRIAAIFALAGCAAAQQDAQKANAELEEQVFAQRRLLNDWGGLVYYGSENTELKPDPDRVVLLGDEVTENWPSALLGKRFLNRGIEHQTTGQMLVRFRQDVVSLKPKAVVIQGGRNDLAGYGGPATTGTIADNVMSMVDIARANGIRVVVTSLIPVCDCRGKAQINRQLPGKILGVNEWLKDYAAREKLTYIDWYSALAQGRAFRADLTADGLLPNGAGYRAMAKSLADAF